MKTGCSTTALLFLLFQMAKAQLSPEAVVDKVSGNLINTVNFNFKEASVEYKQEGVFILYTSGHSGAYQIKTFLSGLENGSYITFAGNKGDLLLNWNGKEMYSGSTTTAIIPQRLDYALIEFEHRFKTTSSEGPLTITYEPDEPEDLNAVFVWITNELGEIQKSCQMTVPLGTDTVMYKYRPAGDPTWNAPIDLAHRTLEAPLDLTDWRYFTGIFLDALIQAGKQFDRADLKAFAERYLDFFKKNIPIIEKERIQKKLIESPFAHYFRYQLLDDFGTQTLPFLEVDHQAHSFFIQKALNRLTNDALRLADGTYCRNTPDSATVWADDLYMGTVLLSRAGKQLGNTEYLDESICQALNFDRLLKDDVTGLYWHGFFANKQNHSSSKWSRANGWTMMAKTELLLALPMQHPKRAEILAIFQSHVEGLKKVQSEDGRWHQVLDNPDTYMETSSTAMFVRSFAEGIINGWLDESYLEPTMKGWRALCRQIDEKGNVSGIVKGTPILFSDEAYNRQKTRLNDPRGLGAVLYASMAMSKLLEKYPDLAMTDH